MIKKKLALGAAAAGVAAAGYYLCGSKDAKKHRKKAVRALEDAKDAVIEKVDSAQKAIKKQVRAGAGSAEKKLSR